MPTSRKAVSMSEFIFQPSADKVTEMLKKGCKSLFRSRNIWGFFFFHSPDILNWLNQFCSSLSKIFTFGQSPNPADFILNHLYFRDHRKHRGLEWKMLRWFNSRKSCLFYYYIFAYRYLFTSKVLTCLVSKEKLKKENALQLKEGIQEKCKIFLNYFSSAFQKKILAYFKSSIARMIHRI